MHSLISDSLKPMTKFFLLLIIFIVQPAIWSHANPNPMDIIFHEQSKQKIFTVQSVISADTIIIQDNSRKGTKIKLIGLKAPEPPKRNQSLTERDKNGFLIPKTEEPFTSIEKQSFDFAKRMLSGKEIRLEYDTNARGPNFETLAYVFLTENDLFVNAEILRQGFADLQLTPRNKKYNAELRSAYQEAREYKRGIQGN